MVIGQRTSTEKRIVPLSEKALAELSSHEHLKFDSSNPFFKRILKLERDFTQRSYPPDTTESRTKI